VRSFQRVTSYALDERNSMTSPQVWEATTYDAARPRLVPDFDAFYGAAALVVARSTPVSPRSLDLGDRPARKDVKGS
jgi:hypothetical protein